MPLIRLETNQPLTGPQREVLCETLSHLVAEVTGKPEQYVQALVAETAVVLRHGGEAGPAAFVEVRGIGGLTAKINGVLSTRVCALLAELGIPGNRVYLNFIEVPAHCWGWDSETFG